MVGRRGDAELRASLVEAAARLLATGGSAALTLRRVATEVGTSTMAVYTHFGGMNELRRAVRQEGFRRLRVQLAAVPVTDDPVKDLALLGGAYCGMALRDADLYRVMFMEQPLDEEDAAVGIDTFGMLVAGVQRCVDGGRFVAADAVPLATRLWVLTHGAVTLRLASLLDDEQILECLAGASLGLFVSYGDAPRRAQASVDSALGEVPPTGLAGLARDAAGAVSAGGDALPRGGLTGSEATVPGLLRDRAGRPEDGRSR